ncbi:PIG-L family deacetylase [Microbacterium sp. RD1]|uniref:PIG-L family deacetylase n=1 Tax=Microbacterium sp. RD1 TaxID=3457313 RepID=UPI003FA52B5F
MAAMLGAMLMVLGACAADPVADRSPTASPVSTASPTAVPVVQPTATPEPQPTPELCDAGSLVAIWAHYDDDLIFGHTRVADALAQGQCVTIAYLSAGDAGKGLDYSRGREDGIRAAYDTLRGYDGQWNQTTDTLETGVTVAEWSPVSDPRLTLLSFRLVDGNIDGSGFASMGYESLEKLANGTIPTVRDVDGPENLTIDDITHSLVEIISDAEPDALLTGMPREAVDLARGDHSDHSSTASFARAAWRSMEYDPAAVSFAIGYQTSDYDPNVSGDELARKVAAFATYSQHDPVVANCHDLDSCLNMRLFGAWLQREYARGASELDLG